MSDQVRSSFDEMLRCLLHGDKRQEFLVEVENTLKTVESDIRQAILRRNSTEAYDRLVKAVRPVQFLSVKQERQDVPADLQEAKDARIFCSNKERN